MAPNSDARCSGEFTESIESSWNIKYEKEQMCQTEAVSDKNLSAFSALIFAYPLPYLCWFASELSCFATICWAYDRDIELYKSP